MTIPERRNTATRTNPQPANPRRRRAVHLLVLAFVAFSVLEGCSSRRETRKTMEVTAYCACTNCTDWERGRWRYLKLNFWNRYVSKGPEKGKPYTGRTASGTKPREPHPGLFARSTITRPWKLPGRLLLPWRWRARDGTVAADTRYHPFGTRLYIPGYGYGVVQDRGGAIKGPKRLDVYYRSHKTARKWGRQHLVVEIYE